MSHNYILIVKDLITNNYKLSILPIMKNVLYELKHVKNLADLSLNYLSIVMTLLKDYSNYDIAFICTKKINECMLRKEWNGSVTILQELSIPYNKTLIQNIQHQAKESIFNVTDKELELQKKIYGYFLLVDSQYNNYGFNASYFFTNKNTYQFFSKNLSSLELSYFNNLKKTLKGNYLSHCIVGEAAVKLLKNNTDSSILKTEIWDMACDQTHMIQHKNINTYSFNTGKIEWFGECYLSPRHEQKVVSGNCVKISSKVICYYKGLKFLYVDSDISNVTIIDSKKLVTRKCAKKLYKANKKVKITSVWKNLKQKITIYKQKPITFMTKFSKGFWIMRPNGYFDIIIAENMYIPFLSLPFIGTGKFEFNKKLIVWSANKFSDNACHNISLECKQSNIKHTIYECAFKQDKVKNRYVKKKKTIINERQRNNISVFSSLL